MINLKEVVTKINNILNTSTDSDIPVGAENPTEFSYMVESVGYHLDKISDAQLKKNRIPVFVSSMGGNLNPVPELKQGNYIIPLAFYFPVKFKESMYALYEYLGDVFIGRILNFGTVSQPKKCICNISIPTYGEIQDLDLKEFKSWVDATFQKGMEVMEPYLTMNVNLYISNAAPGFLYGNDIVVKATIDGQSIPQETLNFISSSLQSNSQAMSEQAIGTNETVGFPYSTTYGLSTAVYVKDNAFFNHILTKWFSGEVQTVRLSLVVTLGNLTYNLYAFVESINLPITKGDLLTMTITYAKTKNLGA